MQWEMIKLALQRISGDRRMVCVIAPVIIGFLPSAGAVNICGAIVDKATGDDLDLEEKTFVSSYYRHISECAIEKLPDFFAGSAIPDFIAFGIIMFLGTIISGANAMIVLLIPLAFVIILTGYYMILSGFGI